MQFTAIVDPSLQTTDGVAEVVKCLDDYCLTREDWDSIVEICQFPGKPDLVAKIPTKVRVCTSYLYSCSSNSVTMVILFRSSQHSPGRTTKPLTSSRTPLWPGRRPPGGRPPSPTSSLMMVMMASRMPIATVMPLSWLLPSKYQKERERRRLVSLGAVGRHLIRDQKEQENQKARKSADSTCPLIVQIKYTYYVVLFYVSHFVTTKDQFILDEQYVIVHKIY